MKDFETIRHKLITIDPAENGYITSSAEGKLVFKGFTELVNYLAGFLYLKEIGEELKIISSKDANEKEES
jgi:hypothetical protein